MPPHCSVSLALVLPTISIVNGWVTNSFHLYQRSRPLIVSHEKYVCSTILHEPQKSTSSLFASTQEDEEIVEYLDEDEDEDDSGASYDPQAALEKQTAWMEDLLHLSKATSIDPGAVESAQEIFDAMFQTYVESDDSTFFPTVEVYNLLLETHAYARTETGAEEAEGILERMLDPSNDFVAKPNEESFMCVMDAWAVRKQPEMAKAVLEKQDSPSIESYNKLIKAYGMADDFDSAESLFRSLLEKGTANHKSWVQIMKAALSHSDDEEEDESLVEAYFDEMQEEGFEPETDAYNLLIRSVGQQSNGFSSAESILFQMIGNYREGDETQKPNAGTFRALLTSYHRQGPKRLGTPSSAAKVEQLLQFMDSLVTSEEQELHFSDTAVVYRMALDIIGWSKDPKKAAKAQRILDKHPQPSLDIYIAVLKACASTQGNSQGKFEAFQIATGILKDLRSMGDESSSFGLTSSSMGLFLQSCQRLMPSGPKRDQVVTKVFRECTEKGLVNDFVLDEFEAVSSEAMQLDLLGGFSVDGVSIPESWSRNVVA